MDNRQVAEVLQAIGRILEIRDENPFKVRAYLNAARTIAGLSSDVRRLVEEKKLGEVPGIGSGLEEKITQLVATGKMDYFETVRREVPPGVLDMLQIPFLGPKKVKVLWKDLGIEDVDALRDACRGNKLLAVKGFGERTQEKILQGIDFMTRHKGQYLLNAAMPVARRLLEHLESCKQVRRASLAGSIRRWKETVRDVDILASSDDPALVMERFVKAEGIVEVLARGGTKASVRLESGLQADLRVVADDQFAPALAYFTGSKEHNVAIRSLAQRMKLKVNEYGIFRGRRALPCRDETEFYKRLGLPYIPPEMRENAGELELTVLPRLVELKSLKGVFHTHSTWSDGIAGIEEMARKAISMGFRYMGVSDHSRSAGYANGLDDARLARQMKEIEVLNRKLPGFTILKGIECDILPDGTLDISPKLADQMDFIIGSIHSHFGMPEGEMTARVCKALAIKQLCTLAHPTGRLLLDREAYKIDIERVLKTARERNKAIELNAHPSRLDLDAARCRRAKELGVLVSIDPDAHSAAGLEDVRYGIGTARRGWLEEKDVLNTRDLDEVRKIFRG